jgi:ribosomal protein S18 acetylase RimI-like enzyme
MTIRPFDLSRDADLYVEGYYESFRESFPGVSVSLALKSSYRDALVNIESLPNLAAFTIDAVGGVPAGFIVVALSDSEAVRQLSIEVLYVRPTHRNAGLGRQLLERAEAHSKTLGANSTRLDVSVANWSAISLYEAAGYAITRYQMEKSNVA